MSSNLHQTCKNLTADFLTSDSMFGFPMGRTFTGSAEDKAKVRKDYERKIGFSKKTDSPIWNG